MKKSAILFSKDHVKSIEFEHRLPPSAIGVRRVCPSSKEVMKELKRLKRVKKEQKIHNNASSTCTSKRDGDGVNPDDDPGPLKTEIKETSAYYLLSVDSKLIQEEVDEIKGIDRAAFNNLPAFLSAPMTQQASKHKLLSSHRKDPLSTLEEDHSNNSCKIDDELTTSWALQLRMSMEAAEALRAKENMRPMAYRLVPEAWSRHRDSAVGAGENDDDNAADDDGQDEGKTKDDQDKNICSNKNNSTNEDNKSSNAFIFVNNIRPVSNNEWRDETHSIVYDCLYNQFPKLHISCGAKFGCDYLLYDGNRKMRHAFAGVRVLMSKIDSRGEIDFNIPTTYNLHGYVRGLNTAGKLALLATVIPSSENEGGYRVAIVDLALEKILSAPTHLKKRKRSNNARKEIGVNLAKVGSDGKHDG
jgi:hypothetical protein